MTQRGTVNESMWPVASRSAAITPIAFWASFAPWPKESAADITHSAARIGRLICRRRPPQRPPVEAPEGEPEADPEHRRDRQHDQHPEDTDRLVALEAAPVDRPAAGLGQRRAGQPPDQRVGGARGQAPRPGDQVPDASRPSTPDPITATVSSGATVTIPAIVSATAVPTSSAPSMLKVGGEDDRLPGPRAARRDQGGDRVGGVVEAVGEGERDREGDGETQLHGPIIYWPPNTGHIPGAAHVSFLVLAGPPTCDRTYLSTQDSGGRMAEKTWGEEPFWGLGYDWDPDWVLTDASSELRETLIGLCESEMRANAKRSDDELLYPRRNFELLAEHGFLSLTVPEEYGGLGENHVALRDGLRDPRPLRLRLDRDVLRDAHRRGGDDHAAPHRRADRHATSARSTRTCRIGTLSYSDPETGSHFWYPVSSGAERSNGGYKVRKKASWTTSGGFADFYVVQTTSPDFSGYDDLSVFVIDGDDVKAQPSLWDALGLRGNQSGPIEVDEIEVPAEQVVGPARRRRQLQRRGGRPLVPGRLLLGLERDRARGDRHRQAPHDPQAPRRRRHAGRRLPDDPGLRRRGGDGHQRRPPLRLLGGPGDGPRHRRQHQGARRPARRPAPTTCTGPGRSSSRRPRTSPTWSTRCSMPAAAPATSATWSWSATCATPRPAG